MSRTHEVYFYIAQIVCSAISFVGHRSGLVRKCSDDQSYPTSDVRLAVANLLQTYYYYSDFRFAYLIKFDGRNL